MILSSSPNWIFLCFTQGAFGHLLGRCISTSPDVAWYDHPFNGENPWNWNHFPPYISYGVSISHFIRDFDDGMATLTSGVRKDIPGFGWFQKWHPPVGDLFEQQWIKDLLEQKHILYPTHDHPEYIRERFPNSKIILLDVDEADWNNVVKNHMEKTGSYVAIVDNGNQQDPAQLDWYQKTGQNTIRDWEQYSKNLTEEEWVAWTVKNLKEHMATGRSQREFVDAVFSSKDRFNVEAIVELHNLLGIESKDISIKKVLDAFNIDAMIGNNL